MKSAQDYPITFPYAAVDGVYYGVTARSKSTYIGPYHRGDDRAMPVGTPVLVNGVQIGLSGQSGEASGPHLHVGRFVGGTDTSPNKGGFSFTDAKVTEVGEDPTNGKFVRIQADGASWVYLHLSKQTVTVGQVLKPTAKLEGEDMAMTPAENLAYTVGLKAQKDGWQARLSAYHEALKTQIVAETKHDAVFKAELQKLLK